MHRPRRRRIARHRSRVRAPVPRRRRHGHRDGARRRRPRAPDGARRDARSGSTSSTPRAPSGLGWQIDGAGFDVAIVNAGVSGARVAALEPPDGGRLRRGDARQRARADARDPADRRSARAGREARRAVVAHGLDRQPHQRASWLYRASKAAVNSVLKDASLALAGNATCVGFHPGWVRTDMGGAGADIDVATSVAGMRRVHRRARRRRQRRLLQLRRAGDPVVSRDARRRAAAGARRRHGLDAPRGGRAADALRDEIRAVRALGRRPQSAAPRSRGRARRRLSRPHRERHALAQPADGARPRRHYATADADGRSRRGLGLGFEIRFRAVVLADEDIECAGP